VDQLAVGLDTELPGGLVPLVCVRRLVAAALSGLAFARHPATWSFAVAALCCYAVSSVAIDSIPTDGGNPRLDVQWWTAPYLAYLGLLLWLVRKLIEPRHAPQSVIAESPADSQDDSPADSPGPPT